MAMAQGAPSKLVLLGRGRSIHCLHFISQKGVEHDRGGAGQKVTDHEIRPESRGTYHSQVLQLRTNNRTVPIRG